MNKSDFLEMDLELIDILRQSLIDSQYVGVCQHCGRPIVNIATVRNRIDNKIYEIGLDCKKTLMDKKHIDKIMASGKWDAEFTVKDYKRAQKDAENFLKYLGLPEKYEVIFDYQQQEFIVNDLTKMDPFGTMGTVIEMYPAKYLTNKCKIREEFLKECHAKNLFKQR